MSEAEWTVGEAAEIARDRREGFVLSPAFFGRAKVQTAMVVAGLAVLGVAVVPLAHYHYGDEGFAFVAIAILSLGSIPLARHWERRQEARHETEPEMRAALGHDGRLVSMIVRQGDAPTGEDWGMLWFEEGRLYFSGRRTSFGLVPEQARGFATVDDSARDVRHRLNLPLALDSAVGPVSLSLAPFAATLSNPEVAVGALRADLDRWKHERAWGEGQWPPLTLGPCVATERRLFGRALGNTVSIPLLPAFVLLLVGAPIVALAALLLGMPVCAFAGPNALVWRAWWARRRLRRTG